ncbi:MAG: hypothetical protein ABH983_03660 [Candidatus Micrarchaeota archaeon]
MGDSFSFHKKTEKFFMNRKKGATPTKAAIALFFASLLTYLVLDLIGIGNILFALRVGIEVDAATAALELLRGTIQAGICALLPTAGILWYLGKSRLKSKASFVEMLYCFSIASLISSFWIAFALFYIALIAPIIFLVSAYLVITAVKTALGVDYAKAATLFVGANIIMAFAWLILFPIFSSVFPSFISLNLNPIEHRITEHEDGSFSIEYENKYGICSFTFPTGWKIANKSERQELGLVHHGAYDLMMSEAGGEYWAFERVPDRVFPSSIDGHHQYHKITVSTGKVIEMADRISITADSDYKEHWAMTMFPDFSGYEAVFFTYTGNDDAFYSIVNSSDCHVESPFPAKETVENEDGTTTVIYEGRVNGKEAACLISLPPGWGFPSSAEPYQLGREWVSHIYYGKMAYKTEKWDDEVPEYILFYSDPPRSIYSDVSCEMKKSTGKVAGREMEILSATYSHIEEKNVEICDELLYDEVNDLVHHNIIYRTLDGLGYTILYESTFENDEDIAYIIANTQCYWKWWPQNINCIVAYRSGDYESSNRLHAALRKSDIQKSGEPRLSFETRIFSS